jgi:hypothetical protein
VIIGINYKTVLVKKRGKVCIPGSKFSVNGAAAIFQKQMLEYRKASYFLFFDKSSIIIILAGIIFRLFMPELSEFKIFAVLFFSAYMLFFFVIQGKWPQEIEKPYIFLIPEPDGKKLLYTTLTEIIAVAPGEKP